MARSAGPEPRLAPWGAQGRSGKPAAGFGRTPGRATHRPARRGGDGGAELTLGFSSAMANAGVSSAAASQKRHQVRTEGAHRQHQERQKKEAAAADEAEGARTPCAPSPRAACASTSARGFLLVDASRERATLT